MDFPALYRFAQALSNERTAGGNSPAVAFKALCKEAVASVDWLACVNVHPVTCEDGDPFGHYECFGEVESAYEQPLTWVVRITCDIKLNFCQRRFVQTKELMHIFDTEEGMIKNPDDFAGLLFEIELEPPAAPSAGFLSENNAKWMALLCLCPKETRDMWVQRLDANEVTEYEMALQFRIPEDFIRFVRSAYYDEAYASYVGES